MRLGATHGELQCPQGQHPKGSHGRAYSWAQHLIRGGQPFFPCLMLQGGCFCTLNLRSKKVVCSERTARLVHLGHKLTQSGPRPSGERNVGKRIVADKDAPDSTQMPRSCHRMAKRIPMRSRLLWFCRFLSPIHLKCPDENVWPALMRNPKLLDFPQPYVSLACTQLNWFYHEYYH